MKDYTWAISARNKYGVLIHGNITDTERGWRQGWYKTELSARKAMCGYIRFWRACGCTEIKWTLYHRKNGIIDEGED